METQFYIVINLKTTGGWEQFGKFFIGNDRRAAMQLFRMLYGSTTIDEHYPLSIDMMETINGLPVNIQMLNCTLPELGENVKIITKELFKYSLKNR